MEDLGLQRHKKHTIIISQLVIKFLDNMQKKNEESSDEVTSSSEEIEIMSADGTSHHHECLEQSEFDPDSRSFHDLNDKEIDKYYDRAKHHVEHL